MLNFNYFADVKKTLYDEEYNKSLELMKNAGVTVLWLLVYMTGRYFAEKSEIALAKEKLEKLGFEVNALTIPVGHPGNSLNPEEALELQLPENWSYRVGFNGEKEYFCACVDDTVIKENRESVELCRDLGIKKLFFDDDLRMSNFGDEIRGCYCERCLDEFAQLCGSHYTAAEIEADDSVSEKWKHYNCSKITRFMKETAVDGIQTGIMVMQYGAECNGIDIDAIKKAVPNCLFRVGEGHFDDRDFESDVDHKTEIDSMKKHISLVGDTDICYSETTVFPPRSLSAQNLMKKIELAIKEGIDNIFLMSGTWVMTEEYWRALAENYSYFLKLSEEKIR